jgi:hypothetical protein
LNFTPGESVVNVPCQVTGLMPPRRPPEGTRNVRPERKAFLPATPVGITVTHRLLTVSNVVAADRAFGSKVTEAGGTGRL